MNRWFCKALFVKELRETIRWTPVGMIIVGLLCWMSIPTQAHNSAGLAASLMLLTSVGFGITAIGLAWLQTLPDMRTDSRSFLLHRPVALMAIFNSKMLAGAVSYFVAVLPPLLITAFRLELLGPEILPVAWTDVLPSIAAAPVAFIMYPAAMWAAYRTARWIGTKTLPMAFSASVVFSCIAMLREIDHRWVPLAFVVMLAIGLGITLRSAWLAFSDETYLPSESTSLGRCIGIAIAATVLVSVIAVFAIESQPRAVERKLITYSLAFDESGTAWELKKRYADNSQIVGEESKIERRRVSVNQEPPAAFEPLPEDWKQARSVTLTPFNEGSWMSAYTLVGDTVSHTGSGNGVRLLLHDGWLWGYNWNANLAWIVTPAGIYSPVETPPAARFEKAVVLDSRLTNQSGHRSLSLVQYPILAADDGVYQLDFQKRQIRKIIDAPVDRIAIALPDEDDRNHANIWIQSENRLTSYAATSTTDQPLDSISDRVINATQSYPLPSLATEKVAEYRVPSRDGRGYALITPIESDQIIMSQPIDGIRSRINVASAGNEVSASSILSITPSSNSYRFSREMFGFPPGLWFVAVPASMLMAPEVSEAQFNAIESQFHYVIFFFMHSLLAAVLANLLCRNRHVGRGARIAWTLAAVMLGVAILLAIVACHTKPLLETCPACEKKRRVDRDDCQHCAAPWPPLPREGVEVIADAVPEKSTRSVSFA
ncbi:MAG: hypothetical protein WBD31_23130 [Rubripirellula sp.]